MNVTELIKAHEGLRLTAYQCTAGRLTIGWGRNIQDKGISEVEAEAMLMSDIAACRRQLTFNLHWFTELDEVRAAALTDLAFQLGWTGLGRFRRFLTAMGAKDWALAKAELLDSKYAQQTPNRAQRVANMIAEGQWPQS